MKFWRSVYYYMDWEYHSKNDPTPEHLRQRHLVMRQIRESKMKLKPVDLIKSCDYIEQIVKNLKEQQKFIEEVLYDDVETDTDTEIIDSDDESVDISEYK